MEATYRPEGTAKLFENTPTPPPMRRIGIRIEPSVFDQIEKIAQYEDLELSATIRELLDLALRYYKFKRGTLNSNLTQNKKTFYCQSCNTESKIRDGCYKQVDFDEYLICEHCMFNPDRLERFLLKVLRGPKR